VSVDQAGAERSGALSEAEVPKHPGVIMAAPCVRIAFILAFT